MTYQKTIFIFMTTFALFFVACGNNTKKEVIHVKANNIVKKELDVKGITCGGCEARLETNLLKVEGVLKFKASAKNNTATVEFDKSKTNVKKINDVLKEMGHEASLSQK